MDLTTPCSILVHRVWGRLEGAPPAPPVCPECSQSHRGRCSSQKALPPAFCALSWTTGCEVTESREPSGPVDMALHLREPSRCSGAIFFLPRLTHLTLTFPDIYLPEASLLPFRPWKTIPCREVVTSILSRILALFTLIGLLTSVCRSCHSLIHCL